MALIVRSKIKEHTELQVAEEFARELEAKVEEMIKKAEERASANQRRTIFARDL
jgi:histone H3/H4